jgi:hypothetical protein
MKAAKQHQQRLPEQHLFTQVPEEFQPSAGPVRTQS